MSKYLIAFDMNTACLAEQYHGNSHTNAYGDIKQVLQKYGFSNMQGSVYIGGEGVSEAHGTLAIQELTAKYDWFYSCVSNIKFYRLESDLDAQFIADGVHQAKQRFNQRLAEMEMSLIEAGLEQHKINRILSDQQFSLENESL